MLKYILVSVAVILCLPGLCSAGLYGPTVILSNSEVVPSVLMPGDIGMVTVTLTNTASSSTTTTSDSIVTTMKEINPTITGVFLDGGKDIKVLGGNSEFSGDLGPQQSVKISFAIEAPEKRGIYYAILRVSVKGSENLQYPIPINVDMPVSSLRKPVLIVGQSGDTSLQPGDGANVTVSLYNSGESTAEDIFIRVVEDEPSLAVINSQSFHIPDLSSGESESFIISFISDTGMEPGVHEIPLEITYNVVDGSSADQNDAIALDVNGKAELSIASLKTDPVRITGGQEVDLTIRIENTGTGDAKSTVAKIDLPFEGNKEAYIGKIKPGNDAPAVFTLDAGSPGEYNYSLTISYEDDTGIHESLYPLTLSIRRNNDETGLIIGIIILIAAAAGGYYYFVYRKREEDKV
ncbi:COG1361 S-layer family protein [Methanolacinia paynteri]|uniref:COG1361 S-layer family protein n=1 Tax=Methanolacinia paynteri TaxID=230356 RepID=UPI00064F8D46|nr:CARDB domain-containing protein [Methanolacinia paynteri]